MAGAMPEAGKGELQLPVIDGKRDRLPEQGINLVGWVI